MFCILFEFSLRHFLNTIDYHSSRLPTIHCSQIINNVGWRMCYPILEKISDSTRHPQIPLRCSPQSNNSSSLYLVLLPIFFQLTLYTSESLKFSILGLTLIIELYRLFQVLTEIILCSAELSYNVFLTLHINRRQISMDCRSRYGNPNRTKSPPLPGIHS